MAKSQPGDPGQAGKHEAGKPNKHKPTTKATPPPPGKKQSHAGHPHGGQQQPKPKKPPVYPPS
jgi:hypothetical protein